jgi:hypothetical protein
VTSAFFALEGRLSVRHATGGGGSSVARVAPDGIAFAGSTIRCETDAVVLCVPDAALARLKRRYPEHGDRLAGVLE